MRYNWNSSLTLEQSCELIKLLGNRDHTFEVSG